MWRFQPTWRGGSLAILIGLTMVIASGLVQPSAAQTSENTDTQLTQEQKKIIARFHDLMYSGSVDAMERGLREHPEFDLLHSRTPSHDTPLMTAARSHRDVARMIEHLIKKRGADLCATNRNGRTALMLAAAHGRLDSVELLLVRGSDLSARDHESRTALMLAARSGEPPIVALLLARVADKEATDIDGRTALHHAAWSGNADNVRACLNAEMDPNPRDHSGRTPLVDAVRRGGAESVTLLLSAGADPAVTDKSGTTPLMQAACGDSFRMMDVLLANREGAVDATDLFGRTALIYAASVGQAGIVSYLIARGADARAQDKRGNTALLLAIEARYTDIVAVVRPESDVMHRSNSHDHALLLAAGSGESGLVSLLLESGAKTLINEPNKDGYTPLMAAASRGSYNAVKALLDAGAEIDRTDEAQRTALFYAAESRHEPDALRLLLESGAAVDVADVEDMTALHLAARRGRDVNVGLLLAHDLDPNARNAYDETPLMLCSRANALESVRQLLRDGADAMLVDSVGKTALMHGARFAGVDVISELMDTSKIDTQDTFGRTALMFAVISGDTHRILFLIDAGADSALTDKEGRTVEHYANTLTLSAYRAGVRAALGLDNN